jgi:choline-glycine betaine transporter
MALFLQIALGIILAVIIIAFFPTILTLIVMFFTTIAKKLKIKSKKLFKATWTILISLVAISMILLLAAPLF